MTGAANMTSIEQPSTATRSTLLAVLLGGLIGAAIACLVLDPQFIRGNGGTWVHPRNDLVAYLVAWNYYIVDRWRLPLFSIPAMSYPEGGNVLFNDALPVTAFMTKVVYHATGARVNPYGWWVFLTYILQGATAARLAFAVGTRSYWAAGAAAVFAIVNIAFVARLGHTAVSSHFLILWVLALYFDSLRHRRVLGLECGAVLALTLLVNAYLFVMIAGFVAVTVITLWWREQLTRRDFARVGAAVGVTFAIGMLAGYGVLLINPTTMKAQGFGHYSWNVISLLLPPEGFFGFLANVPRDATHGQYEGESFIGAGALLVLVLCLVSRPRQVAASLARHWVYVAALAGFAAYAASNLVYVGNVLVVSYPLPTFLIDLGNYFRATGRFIWPLAYSLTILPVAALFRWWRPAPAIAAALMAVCLQIQEAKPGLEYRRQQMAQPNEELIDTSLVESWLAQHQRVWQVPSWDCGGLGRSRRVWGSREANSELQVQFAAARLAVPTNSVYSSRTFKDCGPELAWASHPELDDGTLYLLGLASVAQSPQLARLARSNACVTLDWGVVCSRRWAQMAEDRRVASDPRER
jgi:Family of unknown function (DUF6311)